jgi:hypothetical protein
MAYLSVKQAAYIEIAQYTFVHLHRCEREREREWTGWAHTGGGNALAFKQPT